MPQISQIHPVYESPYEPPTDTHVYWLYTDIATGDQELRYFDGGWKPVPLCDCEEVTPTP